MLVLRATVQVLRGWSSAPMVHSHLAYGTGAGLQAPHTMLAPQVSAPYLSAVPPYMLPGAGVVPAPQHPGQYQAASLQQWPGLAPFPGAAAPVMGLQPPVQGAYLTAQPPSFSQQPTVHMSMHSPGVKASVLREAEPRYLVYMASPTS